ncbi:4-(cytidine 5'-diphospho)-2-C-methyl-D-erythritol kinase [Sphingomicrobium clamense]|uniref:4-diphosphocytidyl-2-C-methyl-D-erythritol kinase n=1 Tax=Sphingomicrobium clamense TaxID=2851013 RepID=A0ABS6V6J2_9SPHN|nr:4-(cytidine 5'-diphospho)-2-C-methyl-D-erythritol kinase [Sphingomicrobium sp. B8]MBW0145156.1 4-(cytidine 5'-diphospho)-2-C-methyl-D-erythritol kinase [Sphingomicrobium sp. B8]
MPRPEDGWLREPAPAKINLALHVRGKRDDGYHELETLFAFCTDGDWVSAIVDDGISITTVGPFAAALKGHDNIILKAANALREASGHRGGARLMLDKRLPVASGIGGGSADAAAALRLLTGLWGIDPTHASEVAPDLGADVPACLLSMTSRGTGSGTTLVEEDAGVSGDAVLLVNPGQPVSTAAVFANWDGQDRGALDGDWREGRNDLEAPAIAAVPEIGEVLDWLRNREGVDIARMSGSGATCFALFDSDAARDTAAAAVPDKWWHLASNLR